MVRERVNVLATIKKDKAVIETQAQQVDIIQIKNIYLPVSKICGAHSLWKDKASDQRKDHYNCLRKNSHPDFFNT
jgi:hypothetical protein